MLDKGQFFLYLCTTVGGVIRLNTSGWIAASVGAYIR